MKFLVIFIVSLLTVTNVYSKDICRQVTTFDALCVNNGILYILSANPCMSKYSISVTVINMKNASLYSHSVVQHDTEDPIPIAHRDGKGVVVIMHMQASSDEIRDYRKGRLDVMLFLVDIEDFRKNARRGELVMDAKFPMFTKHCWLKPKKSKPILHSDCHHGHSLGEFSSLCIVLGKSSANTKDVLINPGVYLMIADICTLPYSTVIIALLFSGYTVEERFTQDKTDKYIAVSSTSSKCGLMLQMHDHYGEHLHSQLKYGCGHFNLTIINAIYSTQNGVICPLSPCKAVGPLKKTCTVHWIYSKQETIEAHIELILNTCDTPFSVWWNIHVVQRREGHIHSFPFQEKEILTVGEKKRFLHLGKPLLMHDPVSRNNGYLYLDWGKVSLFVRGTDLLYVTVLRHFPYDNDSIPLFRTEFWLNDVKEVCPVKEDKSGDTSLKTGLTIACVGMAFLLVIVVILFRRRRRRRLHTKGVGLPYEIQLGEESMQDMEMEDEVHNQLQN